MWELSRPSGFIVLTSTEEWKKNEQDKIRNTFLVDLSLAGG